MPDETANGDKRFIVTFRDQHISQTEAATVLKVGQENFDDGIAVLMSESAPQPGRVLRFDAIGASLAELTDAGAEDLRHDDRVAEVVEDFEVVAHGDCECGGGASSNLGLYGGSMGGASPQEVDPYAAGYEQAIFDSARQTGGTPGSQQAAAFGQMAGPPSAAFHGCPPGFQRRCFRWHPWFPPICFCVPGGPVAPPPPANQPLPWNITQIKADQVWNRVTGKGVKLAIIDTGIDENHPDLIVADGASFVPGNTSWDDDHGHGTHCAGIAGARNNALGVVGVAPECSLYAIKVMRPLANGRASGQLSWILAGMGWAVQQGMDVVSMSLGSDVSTPDATCILAYQRAAEDLINNRCIVISSSGNSGNRSNPWVGQPARCEGFMAVAAVDQSKNLAGFSSRGPAGLDPLSGVEIAAPGVSVRSTARGGGYVSMSGTSMACPHVAGAAALLKERRPNWTPAQIRNRLKDTAEDLGTPGDDVGTGSGLLDCRRAVLG